MEGFLNNAAFNSRGLTARFLYCRPVSKIGSRKFETPDIPMETRNEFENVLRALLNIPTQETPKVITLGANAYAELENFHNWLEPQLLDDLGDMDGWGEKFLGAALRIAGNLHCIESKAISAKKPLSSKTMRNAIEIGKYFLQHAKYTYSLMGADKTQKGAEHILKKLKKQEKRELKKIDCGRFR